MRGYSWETDSLKDVKLNRRRTPINYMSVREVIGTLKGLQKKEPDPDVRKHYAVAGIELSKILLK